MPGFIANPVTVGVGMTDIDVAQRDQATEFLGIGKIDGEIGLTQADLANIKVANTVERIAGRCQRACGLGQVAVRLPCLGQEQVHQLDPLADT